MKLYERKWCKADNSELIIPKNTSNSVFELFIPPELMIYKFVVGCETDDVGNVSFTATLFNRDIRNLSNNNQTKVYRAISKIISVTGTTATPAEVLDAGVCSVIGKQLNSSGVKENPVYLEIALASAINVDTTWGVAIAGRLGGPFS